MAQRTAPLIGRLTVPAALWTGFAILVIHNVEEVLTMGRFLDEQRARLSGVIGDMTGGRFAFSVIVITLLFLAISIAGARSRPRHFGLVLAVAMQIPMGFNGLCHAAMAAWTGGYSPGAVSGLLLSFPYAIFLVRYALREGWVTVKPLWLTALASGTVSLLIIAGLHALSGLLL